MSFCLQAFSRLFLQGRWQGRGGAGVRVLKKERKKEN